jgi:hypothetical protein
VETVRVAGFVVALPDALVKTASYWYPFWEVWAVKEYVVDVELAPGALDRVFQPSVETTHCTVGVGVPDAAAVNEAVAFGATVAFEGWLVIVGAGPLVTVRVAAFVAAFPNKLEKTALNSLPFWEACAVNE